MPSINEYITASSSCTSTEARVVIYLRPSGTLIKGHLNWFKRKIFDYPAVHAEELYYLKRKRPSKNGESQEHMCL